MDTQVLDTMAANLKQLEADAALLSDSLARKNHDIYKAKSDLDMAISKYTVLKLQADGLGPDVVAHATKTVPLVPSNPALDRIRAGIGIG